MALRGAAAELDGAALARGVALGVVVVAPLAALSAWLVGDEAGVLGVVAVLAILVGFAVAGGATARGGVTLPHTHGALAGLLTYGVVQGGVVLVAATAGRDVDVSAAALVLNGLLAASAGMIGAAWATRGGRSLR